MLERRPSLTRPAWVVRMLARGVEASVMVKVWPVPGVLAIFRPYAADSIDFDVDLRELQGQVQLNVLCGFLRAIGRRLSKPVLFAPETDSGHPVLGFDVDADRVVLLADPHRGRGVVARRPGG
ncbi:hypothetical protein [Streptomyces sp. NPDC056165]|uniref:hypothetical protein n=1 Tax=Streptomyces sp. NPDC056165 TaxID=3345733 RepID=UPI0035E2A609